MDSSVNTKKELDTIHTYFWIKKKKQKPSSKLKTEASFL
jgi:hypothetical protein